MSKSKMNMSGAQFADKWKRRTQNSVSDVVTGIDSVTENPAQKAIAAKDKMLMGVTAAVQDGRWEAGLSKVTLAAWKETTKKKVQTRLAQGVEEASGKMTDFGTYLQQTVTAGLQQINSMPDLTMEDNINRAAAMMRFMAANPYKGKK